MLFTLTPDVSADKSSLVLVYIQTSSIHVTGGLCAVFEACRPVKKIKKHSSVYRGLRLSTYIGRPNSIKISKELLVLSAILALWWFGLCPFDNGLRRVGSRNLDPGPSPSTAPLSSSAAAAAAEVLDACASPPLYVE